jgi:hypothetical protein
LVRTRKSLPYRPGPTRLLVTCDVSPVKVMGFQLSPEQKDTGTELHLYDTTKLKGRPESANLFLFRCPRTYK